MGNNLQVSAPSILPAKRTYATAIAECSDHLTEAESFAIVGILLGQFPNCKGDDVFTRSLADLLRSFPRTVAEGSADPRRGVATCHQFLSIASVTEWCRQDSATLHYAADWERRAQRQVEGRKEEVPKDESLGAKCAEWLSRKDTTARMMESGARDEAELRALSEAEQKRRAEASRASITRANKSRIAEYRARGLEPVYADAARTILVSLEMMLRNGHRIEDGPDGRPTLVSPAKRKEGAAS